MSPLELLRSSLQGLTSNKLRSFLTMLGVMIGVAAVILLLAVGNGSSQNIESAISSLGTRTITVRTNGTTGFSSSASSTSAKQLTLQVAQKLSNDHLGHVSAVVPQVTSSLTVDSTAASESSISVIGTTPQYFTVTTAKVGSGSAFSDAEETAADKVAVIGSTLATELFPTGSAIGQSITISGTSFTVLGILATQSTTGFSDPNSVVVIPITRMQRSFTGFGAISTLTVESTTSDDTNAAAGEIEVMLDQYLGVKPSSSSGTTTSGAGSGFGSSFGGGFGSSSSGGFGSSSSSSSSTEPFTITNQSSLLQTRAAALQSFTVLLGAVAAISLLVGGIGVTNVMLVTVTERTREIGIRKAIGAPRSAILGQFLVEAAALTLIGGIVGVVVALIGSNFAINGTQPVILGWSIPLALGVSVAIGVFFGVYPAARAANLKPIEALRAV